MLTMHTSVCTVLYVCCYLQVLIAVVLALNYIHTRMQVGYHAPAIRCMLCLYRTLYEYTLYNGPLCNLKSRACMAIMRQAHNLQMKWQTAGYIWMTFLCRILFGGSGVFRPLATQIQEACITPVLTSQMPCLTPKDLPCCRWYIVTSRLPTLC